jgi:hypothetical protein
MVANSLITKEEIGVVRLFHSLSQFKMIIVMMQLIVW